MTLCNYITGVQKLFELEVIDRLTLLSLELLMQLNLYYLLNCYYSKTIVMHHNILSQYYLTTKTVFKMTIVTRGQGQADEPTDRQPDQLSDQQTLLPKELLLQLEIREL